MKNSMNKELKEQMRNEFIKTYEDYRTVTGLNQFTFSSFGEIVRHIRDNFIDSLIDKTVQMTEERIVQKIKLELGRWNGFGEYYDNVTKFANSIISLITNKSDINNNK